MFNRVAHTLLKRSRPAVTLQRFDAPKSFVPLLSARSFGDESRTERYNAQELRSNKQQQQVARRDRPPTDVFDWMERQMRMDPFFDFRSSFPFLGEVEKMFDAPRSETGLVPRFASFDVAQKDGNYVVTIDIPGVKKEDVKINVKDNLDGSKMLTVEGERKDETEEGEKGKENYRYSSRYGKFSRSVRLPASVKLDAIKATHEHGCLKIVVPKAEDQKPVTEIPIH